MRLRKRHLLALLGAGILLFLATKYALEWRRDFVSAAESLEHARAALQAGDVERTIHYLDEALSRSSLDSEEMSSVIFRQLSLLDTAPPLPLAEAARLQRYRLGLQRHNCRGQSWQTPLLKSIALERLPRSETERRYHLLHPGRELLAAALVEAEILDTFAAWKWGRVLGQELKDTGAINDSVHILRAIANLKTRELDATGGERIAVSPILGWVRKVRNTRPANPDLLRALTIGLAVAQEDDRLADTPLPRENPLLEAIAVADRFAGDYPEAIAGRILQIETRVRAAELAAITASPPAQEFLDDFARQLADRASWLELMRATVLQLRNLRRFDAGSEGAARAAATLRLLAGAVLDRDPEAPDALLALGRMHRHLGRDARARDYLNRAATSSPSTPPSLRALAWDLAVGLAILEQVDMDLADPAADLDSLGERVAAAAERLGETQGDVQFFRGRIARRRGHLRESIRLLDNACQQIGSARPEAFFQTGQALAEAGETGIAARRLEVFLRLPASAPAQLREATRLQAQLLALNLSASEAISRITELCARYPDDRPLSLTRARAVLHATLQTNSERPARAVGLESIRAMLRNLLAVADEEALLVLALAEALLGEEAGDLRGLEAFCRAHERHEAGLLAWCRALRQHGDMAGEERVVRDWVLPWAPPPLADLLNRALARESGPRDLLHPVIRLAFADEPAEWQLGRFWLHRALAEPEAAAQALAAGLAEQPDHPGLLGAQLVSLLESGEAAAARAALAALPPSIPEWQRQLWQAKLLLAVRDFAAAEAVLARLLLRHPSLSEAKALQGRLAHLQGRTAEARLRYRESLGDNPRQPIALERLAEISLAEHESVQAFGYLRRLLRLASPSQPHFESLFLDHLTRAGSTAIAVQFREYRALHAPWDRSNRRGLALLHLEARRLNKAEEMLRQLQREEPGNLDVALLYARNLRERGRQAEARSLLLQAAAASAAADRRNLALAEWLAALGAAEAAGDLLARTAESGGPPAAAARLRLADLLYREGRWAEAEAAYREIPGADQRPDVLMRQAECAIRSGQFATARERIERTRHLVPELSLPLVLEAELALAEGDAARAAAACERALALDPGCAPAHFLRARLRLLGDRGDETLKLACQDLEAACVRDPGLWSARELLARLRLELGQTEAAMANLQLLIAERPENPAPKLALAKLLVALERHAALAGHLQSWRDQRPEDAVHWHIEGLLAQSRGDRRGTARAFAQHAEATGDPASFFVAVDAFVAAGLPESAHGLRARLNPPPDSPEVVLALARIAPADDVPGLLGEAFALVADDSHTEWVLEQARGLLPREELAAWLEERRELAPRSRPLVLALARLREEAGEGEVAAALFRGLAAESVGEERALLLSRAAAAHLAQGDPVRAEATIRQALELAPEHPILLNNAAHLALLAGGREGEAMRLAREAVAASSGDRELHACALGTLAEVLFALRLYDQASTVLDQALGIRETAEDRFLLGRTLLASGRTGRGIAQLRRARELAERQGKTELAGRIAELL